MSETKKKFTVPNAFIIVFGIMILAAILTYIIPAGTYDKIADTSTIDPNSFHYIDQSPTTLWQFVNSISTGMANGSSIIILIFLLGGYFNILIDSKAIDCFVNFLIKKYGNKSIIILPVICILMSVLGAVGVMANPVVAFIPVGLILAKKLKMDQMVAVAMMLVAAYCGFGMSPMCAATVQMAQKIAEIPVLSGFGFRTVAWLVGLAITLMYIMHYANQVSKDPSKSIMGDEFVIEQNEDDLNDEFTIRHAICLITLVVAMGIYIYGSLKYGWGIAYLETIFFCIAVIVAAASGMGADGFVKSFIAGTKQMCFSAMLVGCATAVSVILTNGNIIHTIIYGMAQILLVLPRWLVGPVMYYINVIFNFFVSSGSGQAAIVMPIMAPLSDVIGVSRQMAVCAYQYGDGLSNLIFPTNGTMMASIAIAGVKYEKWLKWMLPLYGMWLVLTSIVMAAGVLMGVA
ncbi:MAG: hypothetical protein LIO92_08410 [Clostridiales bacterium]|nr:hypothetical protein [Clostridiales bacterium]